VRGETATLGTAPTGTGAEIDAAIRQGHLERAEQLLVAAIDRAPKSADLLRLLGRVFLMDRKPLNAAIAIKKAEALAPLDDATRFTLVLAYIAMKQGDWARPELERLIAAEPDRAIYRYWLGRLDYDKGQYAPAVEHFKEALTRDPGFVRAFDNLGLCYEALNRPDEAIAQYRQAVRLNRDSASKSPWPPMNLGILLRRRGELAEAESLLREAVNLDDRLAAAHYQLGVLLEQQDQLPGAQSEIERAAALDPTFADPFYALARIYKRRGETTRAEAAMTTFLRLRQAPETSRP
jgi:tetratricopeptide (TPR) repeat protein